LTLSGCKSSASLPNRFSQGNRRLDGLHIRSGDCREENTHNFAGNRTTVPAKSSNCHLYMLFLKRFWRLCTFLDVVKETLKEYDCVVCTHCYKKEDSDNPWSKLKVTKNRPIILYFNTKISYVSNFRSCIHNWCLL
jgi:hypothetical protein